ncbi:MAG: hypothetical protein HN742_43215 [Lentisphaerae bacterium]|jgi:hypothetical protein|nr:hypothetical protein [Lentisphaerota bacterium]MBT4815232.1 hypothetical protein [Lentisphaerota bacterium]MBT5606062.1 hypothetical protein [Lentisphaerota bacterium]MBT7060295.1 hypothetical protein [Lentisphaerota bacterium]MBT7848749.1 hypothetical protein [Lentisphaerota bacterium]
MKTQLDRLRAALKHQQRYLRFLDRMGAWTILGVGVAGFAFAVVANRVLSGVRLPLAGLVLAGICCGVMAAVILTGSIWLCRKLARAQVKAYQEAIEKLEREQ